MESYKVYSVQVFAEKLVVTYNVNAYSEKQAKSKAINKFCSKFGYLPEGTNTLGYSYIRYE